MKINRRDFLKWSVAAVAALKLNFDLDRLNTVLAEDTDPPIIWLLGSGCAGCTLSALNVVRPTTIDDVLLNKVSLKYNTTLMAVSAGSATMSLEEAAKNYSGKYILVIEGAIPTGNKKYSCTIGEIEGVPMSIEDALYRYAPRAACIVAAGTCSSFGGVSAAAPNPNLCKSVADVLANPDRNRRDKRQNILHKPAASYPPIVNLPSCPVNPEVLIQTLLDIILTGIPTLDSSKRPTKYYSTTIHDICPRNGTEETGIGGLGCLWGAGCRGPETDSVFCPLMKWNNGQGWCIGVNSPCIGCAGPKFPVNPLNEVY